MTKKFSDLGIKANTTGFIGNKIAIRLVVSKPIVIHKYKIEKSNFEKGSGKRLVLQIEYEQQKRIIFVGSQSLMDMIQQVNESDFPFETTIIQLENNQYIFT